MDTLLEIPVMERIRAEWNGSSKKKKRDVLLNKFTPSDASVTPLPPSYSFLCYVTISNFTHKIRMTRVTVVPKGTFHSAVFG